MWSKSGGYPTLEESVSRRAGGHLQVCCPRNGKQWQRKRSLHAQAGCQRCCAGSLSESRPVRILPGIRRCPSGSALDDNGCFGGNLQHRVPLQKNRGLFRGRKAPDIRSLCVSSFPKNGTKQWESRSCRAVWMPMKWVVRTTLIQSVLSIIQRSRLRLNEVNVDWYCIPTATRCRCQCKTDLR